MGNLSVNSSNVIQDSSVDIRVIEVTQPGSLLEVNPSHQVIIQDDSTRAVDVFSSYVTREGNPTNPFINDAEPPPLQGLYATEGMVFIRLNWIQPTSKLHAYTEVFRSPVDNLAGAILVGSSKSGAFVDTVGAGDTYYYWVRSVSYAGVRGPWNSEQGLPATSGKQAMSFADALIDLIGLEHLKPGLRAKIEGLDGQFAQVASELDDLRAQLLHEYNSRQDQYEALSQMILSLEAMYNSTLYAQIYQESTARADAISALAQQINSLIAQLADEQGHRTAAIEELRQVRVDAESALAQWIMSLNAAIQDESGSRQAAILNEQIARVNGLEAVAQDITALSVSFNGYQTQTNASFLQEALTRATEIDAVAFSLSQLNAAFSSADSQVRAMIQNESVARSTATGALAQQINTLSTQFSDADSEVRALIQNESAVRASADSALASNITTLTTSVDGMSATVTQHSNSINGIHASWGIRTETNGRVAGIGLLNGLGQPSKFVIQSDRFEVRDSANNLLIGTTGAQVSYNNITGSKPPVDATRNTGPFAMLEGKVTSTNVDTFFNANAIPGTYIQNLAANKITAGLMQSVHMRVGTSGKVVPGASAPVPPNSFTPPAAPSGFTGSARLYVGETGFLYTDTQVNYGHIFTESISSRGDFTTAPTGHFYNHNTGTGLPRGMLGESRRGVGVDGRITIGYADSAGVRGTLAGRTDGRVATYDYAFQAVTAAGGFAFYDSTGKGYGPFTGGHEGLIAKDAITEVGDILVDDIVLFTKGVSDALCLNKRSSEENEAAPIGVLNTRRPLTDATLLSAGINWEEFFDEHGHSIWHYVLDPSFEEFKADHDVVSVNSVGEGLMNVCGRNGDISKGDLISCSTLPGKGQKQFDNIVRSFTVAKARESVTFVHPDEVKQIACIYLCG